MTATGELVRPGGPTEQIGARPAIGPVSKLCRTVRAHRASLLVLVPLLAIAGAAQAVNMSRYPMHIDDEGTYVAQAFAVLHYGTLGHYTYWYDHPPLGWLQLAGYAGGTDAFGRHSDAITAGREAMLVAALVSAALLWALCRRLRLARWSSALAVLLFALSPLAIQFHRTVYLDNVAVPWLLAALVLALTPQQRLSAVVGSALCFAVAVLSKETTLLVLPALVVLLWRRTRGSGNRRYALTLAGLGFVLACGSYVLYALVKGELLPGPGHVSLWAGIRFQLVGRPGSGSVLSPGTLGYQHLHEWLNLDPVLPAVGAAATLVGLFVRRLRPIAIGSAVLVLVVFKPGYLPVPYVIAWLPLAAVLTAGVADTALRWRPARWTGEYPPSWRHRLHPALPAAVVVAALTCVAVAGTWVPKLRGEFRSDPDANIAASETWIEHNVPTQARMAVDDAYWLDLVRDGYPRDNVVWYYKMDTDRAVERLSPDGWRDYSYLVLTESVRSDPQGLATLSKAIDSSVPVARFGHGKTAVVIRRVLPDGVSGLPEQRRRAARIRLSAGTELLANAAVHVRGAARAALAGGRIDVRAETTLAALARMGSVTVTGVGTRPAEAAAGIPIRSVTLHGQSANAVRAVIAAQPAATRRASVHREPDGGVQVTWPLMPIPAGGDE